MFNTCTVKIRVDIRLYKTVNPCASREGESEIDRTYERI